MDYDVKVRGVFRERRPPVHETVRIADATSPEDAAGKACEIVRLRFGADNTLTCGINTVDAAGPRGVVSGALELSPHDEALTACRSALRLLPPEMSASVVSMLTEEYAAPAEPKRRTRGLLG